MVRWQAVSVPTERKEGMSPVLATIAELIVATLKLSGLKKKQTFMISVSIGQEFMGVLAGKFWFRVSHEITDKMSTRVAVLKSLFRT